MFIEYLQLNNFRLHKDIAINFSESLNYIVGGNAQGKTTLLEAIHLLSTTKSFSNNKDKEIVSFGEDFFQIKSNIFDKIENNILIRYEYYENKKRYIINNKEINRPSEVIGIFPIVFLSPQDALYTMGSPGDRRKLIDSIISQYNKSYLNYLLEYKRILRQRAAVLIELKENQNKNLYNELDVWTSRLTEIGTKIILERKNFLDEYSKYLQKAFNFIREDIDQAEIKYSTIVDDFSLDIEKEFRDKVEKEINNEIKRGLNLVGPHKDDFIFYINKVNLKEFGSQGEHKTFQVAIRFSEYFYLQDKINKNPIFLLDDVFGELDVNRGKKISEYLSNIGQAFITMTDFTKRNELRKEMNDRIIKITDGVINYE